MRSKEDSDDCSSSRNRGSNSSIGRCRVVVHVSTRSRLVVWCCLLTLNPYLPVEINQKGFPLLVITQLAPAAAAAGTAAALFAMEARKATAATAAAITMAFK